MHPDWSSIPTELLLQIISRDADNLKQRLAVLAVCKHWRYCGGLLERLVIKESWLFIRCKKHGSTIRNCSCLEDSLTSVFNHSKSALKKLTLTTDGVNVELLKDWVIQDGLESLSLGFFDNRLLHRYLEDVGQLIQSKVASILKGQTCLRRLKLHFFERWHSFNFLQVEQLTGLKKLHFSEVFNKVSELNSFIQMLPNLEVVEFLSSSIEVDEWVLHFDRTNVSVLRLQLPKGADVLVVDAPALQELELYGDMDTIKTQGGCLFKLILHAPISLLLTTRQTIEELTIAPDFTDCFTTVYDTIERFPHVKTLRLLCGQEQLWEDGDDYSDMFGALKQLQNLEISDYILMHLDSVVWRPEVWPRRPSLVLRFGVGDRLRTLTVIIDNEFDFVEKAYCLQAIRSFKWDNDSYVASDNVPQLAIRLRGTESRVTKFLAGVGEATARRLKKKKDCRCSWWTPDAGETFVEVDVKLLCL